MLSTATHSYRISSDEVAHAKPGIERMLASQMHRSMHQAGKASPHLFIPLHSIAPPIFWVAKYEHAQLGLYREKCELYAIICHADSSVCADFSTLFADGFDASSQHVNEALVTDFVRKHPQYGHAVADADMLFSYRDSADQLLSHLFNTAHLYGHVIASADASALMAPRYLQYLHALYATLPPEIVEKTIQTQSPRSLFSYSLQHPNCCTLAPSTLESPYAQSSIDVAMLERGYTRKSHGMVDLFELAGEATVLRLPVPAHTANNLQSVQMQHLRETGLTYTSLPPWFREESDPHRMLTIANSLPTSLKSTLMQGGRIAPSSLAVLTTYPCICTQLLAKQETGFRSVMLGEAIAADVFSVSESAVVLAEVGHFPESTDAHAEVTL